MPPKNKTFYIALLLLFLGLLPAYSSAAENDHENLFGVSDNKIEAYHAYLSAVYGSHSEETGDNIDKRKNKRRRDKNDFHSDPTYTTDSYRKAQDSVMPGQLFPDNESSPDSAAGNFILPTDSSITYGDSTEINDSTILTTDSLATDSAKVPRKEAFQDVITYHADDSAVFTNNNMGFLFGGSIVTYQTMELTADEMHMDMDSSQIFATGRPDSIGDIVGKPVFKDPSGEYETSTMKYNFDSQKAFITNVITQQGEGYLTGGKTKKNPDDSYFLKDGKYTTCDNHEHPHFYLQLTKAKMRPKKDVVAGPAYMVLGDVPLPLAIPFGYFPFSEKYSSGIIMPTFGDETARGFYLRDGGYYFAINDYIDLALTGEIYTKGSWGLNAQSAYVKRYKFSGNFFLSYLVTVLGDKGMPDYSKQTNFKLTWSHTQDRKANPNLTFSASVNFATSGYSHNNLTNYGNSTAFTTNTTSSTVSLSYNVPNSPFSIALTANVTQRNSDSTLNVSFPNLTINMSRIYPFKRKNRVGKEKWYEKISFNYTGNLKNSIQTKQNMFLKSNLIRDWSNGMQHNIPISATFSVFKYINITPSFSFTDRMYTHRIMQEWDPRSASVVRDTTYGFYNVYNYSFSVSAQTKLYGYYRPLPFIGKKIPMIRHVLTPTIRVSGAPDFGSSRYGYWQRYTRINTNGTPEEVYYSPFAGSTYGVPNRGKTGTVSFSVANNLEMKVNTDKDTTGVRKVSLIENLSASMSYNMAADSLNWSNINTSLLIKLTKQFNLQVSAVFDPYTYQLSANGSPVRVNVPRWKAGKGFARLSSAGTSFSYTFNNSTFKRKNKSQSSTDDNPVENPEDEILSNADQITESGQEKEKDKEDETLKMRDGYMVWEVPWSLSINYSINYGYGDFNKEKMEYDGRINQNLSISGSIQPTKNWSFSFSASYNFVTHRLAYMNCNLTRDMHCWSMSASFIPVGAYKSYNFSIRVKSSILSDLKYDKSGNSYDALDWY